MKAYSRIISRSKVVASITYLAFLGYTTIYYGQRELFRSRIINIIPFKNMFHVSPGNGLLNHSINIFGNIVLFIPLPFLLNWICNCKKTGSIIGFAALSSVFIESVQYAFELGVADINDVLLNTLGAAIGLLLFKKMGSFFSLRLSKANKI